MKNKLSSGFIICTVLIFIIQSSLFISTLLAQLPNTWIQRANFPGVARVSAVGFSIGSKGYVGTGQDTAGNLLADFWEYNPSTNTWTQLADFAGSPRRGAVGFSMNGKGYIGTGFDGTNNLKDFWMYDTLTGSWTQKRSLGGIINAMPRREAASFVMNNKAYVVSGYDGTTFFNKECWQYDGDTTWTKKADMGFGTLNSYRRRATGFAIDTNGYVCCGYNYSQDWKKDIWKYNLRTNTWVQMADFGGQGRGNAVAFTINGKGFVGTGNNEHYQKDFWRYNPVNNTWIQVANYGGEDLSQGIAFSINGNGYTGLGCDSLLFRNDFWIYTPDSTIGINEQQEETMHVTVFPNPFTSSAVLKIDNLPFHSNTFSCIVYDLYGKKLREEPMKKNALLIERKNLPPGIYFYSVINSHDRKIYSSGKIIIE